MDSIPLSSVYWDKALNALSASAEGRFFIGEILARCGIYAPSVDVNQFDSVTRVYYNEGMRAVGSWLKKEADSHVSRGFAERCINECTDIRMQERAETHSVYIKTLEDPFGDI